MNLNWVLDKRLVIIPILILLASVAMLGYKYTSTGQFIDRSIELRGGNLITITTSSQVDQNKIENLLSRYDVSIRTLGGLTNGATITTQADPDEIINLMKSKYTIEGSSVETVGPVLGEVFWEQTRKALVIGFLLMSLTVFVFFRKLGPSLTVIAAAATNIIMTIAMMNLVGIELSLATLAALLLLIGYSVDTNILLTMHTHKTGKTFDDGVFSAMKTGITTTATTIVALLAIFVAPTSHILNSIAAVLIIGLLFDVINTWITNVNLLRWLK